MTDRALIGDVPEDLSAPQPDDKPFTDFLFHEGEGRMLSGEYMLTEGRLATMSGLVHCSPLVGAPGHYVALRYYRDRLLKGELFLNAEDVVSITRSFSGGSGHLQRPTFPGELRAERAGQIIRITKLIDLDVLDRISTNGEVNYTPDEEMAVVGDVELTKQEMTNFARTAHQSL